MWTFLLILGVLIVAILVIKSSKKEKQPEIPQTNETKTSTETGSLLAPFEERTTSSSIQVKASEVPKPELIIETPKVKKPRKPRTKKN